MEEIKEILNKNQRKCDRCGVNGLYVATPSGADAVTCPFCGKTEYDFFCPSTKKWDYECECCENGSDDKIAEGFMCPRCNGIFGISNHKHAYNGCCEDIYFASLFIDNEWHCTCPTCIGENNYFRQYCSKASYRYPEYKQWYPTWNSIL